MLLLQELARWLTACLRIWLAAVSVLVLSSSALSSPEVTDVCQHGVHEVSFKTGDGHVQVYLPADMVADDTISGTICINRKSLNNYWLEVGDQKFGACLEHFSARMPGNATSLKLCLRNKRGEIVGEAAVPCATSPIALSDDMQHGSYSYDPIGQAGSLMKCTGKFDGDFTSTSITMNGQNCLMVAESPRQLCYIAPANLPGRVAVELKEQQRTVTFNANLAVVSIKGPFMSVLRGARAFVTVEVTGLDGTERVAQVKVLNLSPGVVTLEGGNDQLLNIPGGNATYTRNLPLRALNPGYYSISAFLWRY